MGEQILLPETEQRFTRALEVIPEGSMVSVEGPPIYLSREWSQDHEFGYNSLIPFAVFHLEQRESDVRHAVLLDDYSEPVLVTEQHYTGRMRLNFGSIEYESELIPPAEIELQRLIRDGRTISLASGEIFLSEEGQPLLRTKSGRLGCALLDGVYQRSKGEGWHVVIHPRSYRGQQKDMRSVLKYLEEVPRPFHLLNIFTRRDRISQVLHTDLEGITVNI